MTQLRHSSRFLVTAKGGGWLERIATSRITETSEALRRGWAIRQAGTGRTKAPSFVTFIQPTDLIAVKALFSDLHPGAKCPHSNCFKRLLSRSYRVRIPWRSMLQPIAGHPSIAAATMPQAAASDRVGVNVPRVADPSGWGLSLRTCPPLHQHREWRANADRAFNSPPRCTDTPFLVSSRTLSPPRVARWSASELTRIG